MGFSLGKIVSPIGSLLNGITGVTDTADESYKVSKKLMSMENSNNVALWSMQNAYNTPAAQIARMKDAGIDVNPMTYAVGNGNMSTTASSISTAGAHMPSYSPAGNPISTLMGVLNGVKDLEIKDEQKQNLYEQRQLTSENWFSRAVLNRLLRYEADYAERQHEIFKRTGKIPERYAHTDLSSEAAGIFGSIFSRGFK